MIIAITSVLVVAGVAFALQRMIPALHPKRAAWFCPVCIGVSMSWLWILVSLHSGWLTDSVWIIVAAILVGGSAAGIADRLSQDLAERGREPAGRGIGGGAVGASPTDADGGSPKGAGAPFGAELQRMPVKLAIIAVGFAVAYAAIRSWVGVVIAIAALIVVALTLARRGHHGSATATKQTTDELKRKLEQCC